MVIDLDKCVGCQACTIACKEENNVPHGSPPEQRRRRETYWNRVLAISEGGYPTGRVQIISMPCMHCDNAPCVKVCPVGARYKREDGLVLTDFKRCIGCRYCEVACPYGVNYFNWKRPERNQYFDWNGREGDNVYGSGSMGDYIGDTIPPYQNPDHKKLYGKEKRLVSGDGHYKGVVGKCTFCVHRLDKGLLPACVANCPVNVFHFGDLDDPNSEVSRLLGQKRSFRLLEENGTQPRVYYLQGAAPTHGLSLEMPSFAEVSGEEVTI